MKKIILTSVLLIILLGSNSVNAQTTKDLYMPTEIVQAYQNQTRSFDGRPAKNYFQNRADYVIKTEFFPDTKIQTGTEIITYKNNSKDSLDELYFNLYQNLYKKGAAKDADMNPVNLHDGVEITNIKINGILIKPENYWFNSTIFSVPAPNKISPNSETKIEIEWKQTMPVTVAKRQGTYDETNFFIAYWYPKICVYDDIDGWNTVGYKGNAEFYSEYGNFDVEITVPAEYNVWSSGVLQNVNEVFNEKIIK